MGNDESNLHSRPVSCSNHDSCSVMEIIILFSHFCHIGFRFSKTSFRLLLNLSDTPIHCHALSQTVTLSSFTLTALGGCFAIRFSSCGGAITACGAVIVAGGAAVVAGGAVVGGGAVAATTLQLAAI